MSLTKAMRFDRMITTEIVTALFWVLSAIAVIVGVGMFIVGIMNEEAYPIVMGGVVAVVGPLFLRLWAEAVIIIFRIYETLVEIRDQWGGMAVGPTTPPDPAPAPLPTPTPPPARQRPGKFIVRGRDRDSGFETEVVVQATDQTDAMQKGAAKGVDVDRVEPA
ncbi:DUF4282 domain-containing protein [Phycisphaerales bacterium AB-hyl4]|uniref:DUF4282 domain-containing protein n=1 Tax=Natronomicrosphaera hydrolytica TaxID=3242702 RepID=A0ABV4U2U5_9BACT